MKAHITNLGLENFRVFKDKTHFEFAPITILTGTNSSGKSSLISAMEMLQGFDIQTELNSRHGLSEYEFPTILKDISFLKLSKFAQSKGDFTNLESTKGKNKGVAFSFPGLIKGLDTVYCHLTLRYVGKSNEIGYENGELKQLLIETFEQNNEEISTIELFKIDFASKFNNVTINWKYFYKYYKKNAEDIINKPKKTSEGDDKESRSLAKLLDTNKYRALLNDFLIYDEETDSLRMFDPEQTFLNISMPSNQNAKEWFKGFISFYEENSLGIENEIDDTSDLSAFFEQINRVIVPKLQQAFVARKEFIYKNSATNWGGYQDPDTILKSIHLDSDIRKDQSECYDILDSFLCRYGLPLNFSTDANGKAAKKFMESFILKGVKGFLEQALPNFRCINFLNTNRNISRRRIDIIDLKQLPNQTEYLVNLLIQADKKTQEGIKTSLNQYFSHEFLNIADEVKISSQDEAKDSAVIMLRKGVHWFNLADEGFGINMVFSVVLLASMANDKLSAKINRSLEPSDGGEIEGWGELGWPAVLVIEEPESNLHPALQSKLADVFVDVAKKFNTQFIIETHSEYLIRKLQYLTAKGGLKPEDTAIYYFYPPDDVPPGEDQVKRIDIQEDGSLTDDFGTGFFDEADKIAMSIWNMNKSQKN